MSKIVDPTPQLAARIRTEREARGWSLAELAMRSGVSRAMISKVERGEASPTAVLLARLSGALQLTMSALLAGADAPPQRLSRLGDQAVWIDPETGYRRRTVHPSTELPLDVVEIELPAGAVVASPASAFTFTRHLIWMREGVLTFVEGAVVHELEAGDCLELGPALDCRYENRSGRSCSYAVMVMRR